MSIQSDIIRITAAFLSLLKLLLSSFGINIHQEAINTTVNVLSGLMATYALIKHNFIGKKGKKQKEHLKKSGLL